MNLPSELRSILDGEIPDFTVKAKRKSPKKDAMGFLFFGLVWTIFTLFFVAIFIGPLFFGQEVHFTSNGVPTVASPDNLEPIIFPAIFLSFFLLIGFSMLGAGLFKMIQKGGYFVGTPTRLIAYRNGNLNSYDWEQFTGNAEVRNKNGFGSLVLELRSGRMGSKGRYYPDKVSIVGVPNIFNIEQKCRVRIKENDPTPSS